MIDEVPNKILKQMTIAGNTYIAEQVARLLYEAGISIDGEWTAKPLAHAEDNLLYPYLARFEVKGLDFSEHDKKVIADYLAEHNVDDNEESCEKFLDDMKKMYDGLDQSLNALSERMKILSKRVAKPFEVDKCVRHEAVCTLLNDIYQQKNAAYGDSFGNTYRELGIISAVTMISDKFNRLKTLVRNGDIPTGDESIGDTLLDVANYCIMTYMELENEQNRENEM